jgi:hypothetical protein
MSAQRNYFGNAAHFIGADDCHFHIATQIGEYLISTVGEYRPLKETGGYLYGREPVEIGINRKYETMVFRAAGPCQCGCGMPEHSGSEIDFSGYNTRAEANVGHEALCAKYEAISRVSHAEQEATA